MGIQLLILLLTYIAHILNLRELRKELQEFLKQKCIISTKIKRSFSKKIMIKMDFLLENLEYLFSWYYMHSDSAGSTTTRWCVPEDMFSVENHISRRQGVIWISFNISHTPFFLSNLICVCNKTNITTSE